MFCQGHLGAPGRPRVGHPAREDHARQSVHGHARDVPSPLEKSVVVVAYIKLVIFTLVLCSSAGCSSPDATATRRRRQPSKHWTEHHGKVLRRKD